jgi:hypothetical protein
LKEGKASEGFFFEKKKQKTFDSRGRWRGWCLTPQDQSFFASFCLQKEGLAWVEATGNLFRNNKQMN